MMGEDWHLRVGGISWSFKHVASLFTYMSLYSSSERYSSVSERSWISCQISQARATTLGNFHMASLCIVKEEEGPQSILLLKSPLSIHMVARSLFKKTIYKSKEDLRVWISRLLYFLIFLVLEPLDALGNFKKSSCALGSFFLGTIELAMLEYLWTSLELEKIIASMLTLLPPIFLSKEWRNLSKIWWPP